MDVIFLAGIFLFFMLLVALSYGCAKLGSKP
jgi:hypothetical protein